MRIARSRRTSSAFTMIEIALAIGIIGFALIAIMGGLPRGLDVQRDNRADTIINQDANFFMEAIRSGSTGIVNLASYVEGVTNWYGKVGTGDNRQIIALLSTPPDPNPVTNRINTAIVRAISGAAAEKGANNEVAFRYKLSSEIVPFTYGMATLNPVENSVLASNLYEIRLTFEWPVIVDRVVGNGRQVYRSLAGGALEAIDPAKPEEGWLFHPRTYAAP